MQNAFYDPSITYEENYIKGPPVLLTKEKPKAREVKRKYKHLGYEINLPFGIPPGPLLNSKYIQAAFEWGFDVSTYKTVRTSTFDCHPFPNVLPVSISSNHLDPEKTPVLTVKNDYPLELKDLSITNSFGVPSKDPAIWQEDVVKSLSYQKDGQLLILSFMGTVRPNQTDKEFVNDFVKAAKLSKETGAKVLEANLSCPNIGNEGLVCYNLDATEEICREIKKEIKDTPLIIKVGYYKKDQDIKKLAEIAAKYADGIAAINTLQVEVVDQSGQQALPGKNRLKSGICGAGIKWAGVEMIKKLSNIKKGEKYGYELIGVGGVMSPSDYNDYINAGADCVQSATGAMWNKNLAFQIWDSLNEIH